MLPQLINLDSTMDPRKPHKAQFQDTQLLLLQAFNNREYMTLVHSTRQVMPNLPQDMLPPRDMPYRTITLLPERITGLILPALVFPVPSRGQFQGQGPSNMPQRQHINNSQIAGTLTTLRNLEHKSLHPRNTLHSIHQIPSMVVVRTITKNLLALSLAKENSLTV